MLVYKLLINKTNMVNTMNFNEFTHSLNIGDDILTESIITGYEMIFESEVNEFMKNIYKLDVNKQRELLENGYSPSNAIVDVALSTLHTKLTQNKMGDNLSPGLVVNANEMKSLLVESFGDKLVGGISKVVDGVIAISGKELEKNDDKSSSDLVESTTEEVIEMAEAKLGLKKTDSELDDKLSEDNYVDTMDDSDELLDEEYSLPEDQDTDEFVDIDTILAEIDL